MADVVSNMQVISEVVATFLLVFVTCGAASLYGEDVTRVSQLGQSLVGGLIVTVMIYATGHISGAHMNPAVTLSFACFRHFPWIQVIFFHSSEKPDHTFSSRSQERSFFFFFGGTTYVRSVLATRSSVGLSCQHVSSMDVQLGVSHGLTSLHYCMMDGRT
jgi:hypothetical protein